jgi:hypothetical protein
MTNTSLRRDFRYFSRMNDCTIASLKALGAIEDEEVGETVE